MKKESDEGKNGQRVGNVQPMEFLKELAIILAISAAAEQLALHLPLPVPASIYGIVFLFLALWTNVLKVSQIRDAAYFLIDIMAVLFVPAAVGLMNYWDELKANWLPLLAVSMISTVLVMGAAGTVTQLFTRRTSGGDDTREGRA